MKRCKSVDEYISAAEEWQPELERLRGILCSTALAEEIKWGAPCYTYKGKNIKPAIIKRYAKEAIALVDAGKEIKADRSKPLDVPDELMRAMRRYKGATAAFRKLTPGKQREYAEHIASAKRDATKQTRIEKVLPMIAAGAGLHDKYRNC